MIIPLAASCGNDSDPTANDEACATSPAETAGPFPTKSPTSLVIQDIRSDRTGIDTTVTLSIQNKNTGCGALEGAIVDIWHCDKDGYYSEYGGTGLQPLNLTAVHFLRGRQSSDTNGKVSFLTIFPGWYGGRAPHIHIHVYDASGKSLLVTQIAFPTEVNDTVYTTATQFYTKGKQDTSNSRDGIFADSLARQMSVVTGNIDDGYTVEHTIIVNA